MKIKCIVFCLILLIITGCKAEYNLIVNKDKSSNEIVTIHDYENYYSSSAINNLLDSTFINTDNVKFGFKDNDLIIERNMKEYITLYNNNEIEKYFGNINITANKISFKPNYEKCIFLFSDGGEFVSNDTITINVKLPFNIKKSNADKIENDIYTWIYGAKDCKKEAYIDYSTADISIGSIIFLSSLILIAFAFIIIKKKYKA